MATIEEKIQKLEEKLKQEKAKKARIEARKRSAEQSRTRQQDTRRKVLLGAFLLDQIEKNGIHASMVTYESARFADWLKRSDDRALFDLQPLDGKGLDKLIEETDPAIVEAAQAKANAMLGQFES
jgi:hypothetical protein